MKEKIFDLKSDLRVVTATLLNAKNDINRLLMKAKSLKNEFQIDECEFTLNNYGSFQFLHCMNEAANDRYNDCVIGTTGVEWKPGSIVEDPVACPDCNRAYEDLIGELIDQDAYA